MALQSMQYLNPPDVKGMGLTPERTNYLDAYDLRTYDIPHLRQAVIEKYNNTITGFIEKFSEKEPLTSDQYRWAELEQDAITYDDAVLTVGANTVLTRAAGAKVAYRLHEKVQLHTSLGAGVFIVTEVVSDVAVNLGTYDAGSIAVETAYTTALSAVYVYSLGIEVGKGSLGADFTAGLKLPYRVLDNIPAITRDVYTELGSATPDLKWVMVNGQPRWFIAEIDATRERFLGSVEKKLVDGDYPAAASDAATAGLQGTQGAFAAVSERGATFDGEVTTTTDIESLIDHFNKVQAPGTMLFLCNQSQEFAFDGLGRTFNASYGSTGALDNHIGDYDNAASGKTLKLGFKGFEYGGYTLLKQGWKYLKENTFHGNSAIAAADRINFLAVPVGMTPVSEGDQNLAYNPRKVQRNYLSNLYKRDYETWTEGGAFVMPRTNGDDSFKVHFLNESLLAVFAAEKFIIGKGVA